MGTVGDHLKYFTLIKKSDKLINFLQRVKSIFYLLACDFSLFFFYTFCNSSFKCSVVILIDFNDLV